MTTFDDRQRAAEAKFALDDETRFRITARRNKITGLWAAGMLGKTGEAAETYARDVVLADFEEQGDEDIIRKLSADLEGHATEAEIRARLTAAEGEARAQIVSP